MYNTPKRMNVVKTRLDDEELADLHKTLTTYDLNCSEFLRQAIKGAIIKPVIRATYINDELLTAIGKLTASYDRIGNNLNQIARHLNTYNAPYPELANDLRGAKSDLDELKYQILKITEDTLGNIQTYRL